MHTFAACRPQRCLSWSVSYVCKAPGAAQANRPARGLARQTRGGLHQGLGFEPRTLVEACTRPPPPPPCRAWRRGQGERAALAGLVLATRTLNAGAHRVGTGTPAIGDTLNILDARSQKGVGRASWGRWPTQLIACGAPLLMPGQGEGVDRVRPPQPLRSWKHQTEKKGAVTDNL